MSWNVLSGQDVPENQEWVSLFRRDYV